MFVRHRLEWTVFGVGFISMATEILGLNVIGPYFGTSLQVSSNLIGVVLLGLAIGYFLGGKIADRSPRSHILSLLLAAMSIWYALVFSFREWISGFVGSSILNIVWGSLLASLILFGVASVLFGMVLPFAVRLSTLRIAHSGEVSGKIYGFSACGSVLGTLAAGFLLAPALPFAFTLFLFSSTLALLAMLFSNSPRALFLLLPLFGILFFSTQTIEYNSGVSPHLFQTDGSVTIQKSGFKKLADVHTPYGRDQVFEGVDETTGKPVRFLRVNRELHSGTFLDSNELIFNYAKFNELGGHFNPESKKALLIGGGGYSYPKFFLGDTPLFDVEKVWRFQGGLYSNQGKVTAPFITSSDPIRRKEKPALFAASEYPSEGAEREGFLNILQAENQLPGSIMYIARADIHETGFPDAEGFVHVHEVRPDGSPGEVISPDIPVRTPGNLLGHSDLIHGANTNIEIPLDRPARENEVLYAMLHRDNENKRFDTYLIDGYSKIREMHVVEIDPEVTNLAAQFFDMNINDPRLSIFHEDGRTYINTTKEKYDIIYLDVFRNFYAIPFQLTTQEAVQKLYAMLNPGGVVVFNTPTALRGNNGKFFQAELRTYQSIFKEVHVYAVTSPREEEIVQNIILIAFKSPERIRATPNLDPAINERLTHRWRGALDEDATILTDEYAPTDYFVNEFAKLRTL